MTVVGSFVSSLLPERAMSGTMQIAMLFIGLRFLLKPVTTTKEQMAAVGRREQIIKSLIGGIIVGFICGFVGAGGGMMLLFVLTSFLGYEMHMAVGTSVFIMAFTALTGGVSHFVIGGMPDVTCLILCVVFTLLWAKIAAVIAACREAWSRRLVLLFQPSTPARPLSVLAHTAVSFNAWTWTPRPLPPFSTRTASAPTPVK